MVKSFGRVTLFHKVHNNNDFQTNYTRSLNGFFESLFKVSASRKIYNNTLLGCSQQLPESYSLFNIENKKLTGKQIRTV